MISSAALSRVVATAVSSLSAGTSSLPMALDLPHLGCKIAPASPSSSDNPTRVTIVHPVSLDFATNRRHIVQTHVALAQAALLAPEERVVRAVREAPGASAPGASTPYPLDMKAGRLR